MAEHRLGHPYRDPPRPPPPVKVGWARKLAQMMAILWRSTSCSPSYVLEELGHRTGEGFALGVDLSMPPEAEAIAAIARLDAAAWVRVKTWADSFHGIEAENEGRT